MKTSKGFSLKLAQKLRLSMKTLFEVFVEDDFMEQPSGMHHANLYSQHY